jgi:hypothetical protein
MNHVRFEVLMALSMTYIGLHGFKSQKMEALRVGAEKISNQALSELKVLYRSI